MARRKKSPPPRMVLKYQPFRNPEKWGMRIAVPVRKKRSRSRSPQKAWACPRCTAVNAATSTCHTCGYRV